MPFLQIAVNAASTLSRLSKVIISMSMENRLGSGKINNKLVPPLKVKSSPFEPVAPPGKAHKLLSP